MGGLLGSNLVGAWTTPTSTSSTVSTKSWFSKNVVKKASRHVSQGAGVRAQSGTRTGYAHTTIRRQELEEAARQARAIADRPASPGGRRGRTSRPHDLYTSPRRGRYRARGKLDLMRKIDVPRAARRTRG